MKSKGVGDSIEKITKATGIKDVVEFLEDKLNFDCGCEDRKIKLNKLFPYRKIECLNEDEYNYLSTFDWQIPQLTPDIQQKLLNIFNRVFNEKRAPTSCAKCWGEIIDNLRNVYNEYK